ncbi:hypothetical protein ACFWR9_38060 [Streptomyces sp. NPDC058534]|uniref:hypothetical protein n=1 Tax=Streptomyces sp. NPDC058534 TaxID=3346541 RepID=UPI00366187F6
MTLVAPPSHTQGSGSLPFLGHAVQLLRDNLGFVAALRTTYGPSLDKGRFFERWASCWATPS